MNTGLKILPMRNWPKYNMNENGDIFIAKTNKEINKKKHINATLYDDNNKTFCRSVMRLLYETFYDIDLSTSYVVVFENDKPQELHYDNLIAKKRSFVYDTDEPIILDITKDWLAIKGFEAYLISNHGDIYSCITNIIMQQTLDVDGYYVLELSKDGKSSCKMVHRLVLLTFKGLEGGKNKVVDHKNQIRTDNYIENLREVTVKENILNRTKKPQTPKKIVQISKNNEKRVWNSYQEITKETGFNVIKIKNCCSGHIKTAYDCKWEFEDRVTDLTGFETVNMHDGFTYSNYKVHKDSTVINKHNMKLVGIFSRGYLNIALVPDGKTKLECVKSYGIHVIVASTFIPNPENKPMVNHKNKEKFDNKEGNLEWCDAQYNSIHSAGIPVNQLNKKTKDVIQTFPSMSLAFEHLKKNPNNTIKHACEHGNTAYGFKWSFAS